MSAIRNIKIRSRLILGFTIVILLSFAIGYAALRNIKKATESIDDLYNHPFTVSNTVRDISIMVSEIHAVVQDAMSGGTPEELDKAMAEIDALESQVYAKFKIVEERFLGDKSDVENLKNLFDQWKPLRDRTVEMSRKALNPEEKFSLLLEEEAQVSKIKASLDVLIAFANKMGDKFYKDALNGESKASSEMTMMILLILIFSIVIVVVITQSIVLPLRDLEAVASSLTSGDLSVRCRADSTDEVGTLGKVFNTMSNAIEGRSKVLTGVGKISNKLIGHENITLFADVLIKTLKELSASQLATFYLLNEKKGCFELISDIGANEKLFKLIDAERPFGEFSAALLSKKLTINNNIPSGSIFKYQTIAGEILPKAIMTLPIIANHKVYAIVGMASITSYSAECIEVMEQSCNSINSALATLIANKQVKESADELILKNQQLEAQTEELQEQSEELSSQAEELRHNSEELYEKNLKMEMQQRQVVLANQLKTEFLSNMSHELRTPLNSINALSKVLLIQAENLTEEERNYMEVIERNGKRLLSLINDILDLSKIEAGRMDVYPKEFLLNKALSASKDNLLALAEQKGLTLKFEPDEGITFIESDENKLNQIITNLIGNAIKFTEKGEIIITSKIVDGTAIIEIKDTGIGIDAALLPHIFDEFRQVDGSTSRSYEGTGLGLAITKKLLQVLKGTIEVESKKDKGSLFRIKLPVKWQGIETINSLMAENEHIEGFDATKKLILVVDDELKSIRIISEELNKQGYRTLSTTSGAEALLLAQKRKPFAITLDISMPEMDGWEVLQKLREKPETANIPVIVISSSDDVKTGLALGAIGYVQKPISGTMLIREIRKAYFNAKKIMVVDDSELDRMFTERLLRERNMDVLTVDGGRSCLERIKTDKPDVLILDLMMPDMDGFSVIKTLRADPDTIDLPIIVITAKDLTPKDKQELNGKAISVTSKSHLDSNSLLDQINRLLERAVSEARFKPHSDGKMHVLMIEDNASAIIQVKKALNSPKLQIDEAGNGKDALDYVKDFTPDGIILDLMMPEMDGFELIEKLRSNKSTQNIPILILTAKTLTKADYDKLSANNVHELLQKGDVDVKELEQKVFAMLKIEWTETVSEMMVKDQKLNTSKKSNGLPKILLIEDNPDNRITAKAILGKEFHYVEARDGIQGLKTANEELPDLILLDIALPGKDGFEVVRELKQNKDTSRIPVIALTAKAMKNDREEILMAGFDEYVSKPINDDELRSKVEIILSA